MVLEEATTHRVELPDGEHLAVQVVGAGPDVLLLHGIPGSGSVWDGVATRLAEHHRVVVPDLLGFGESSRPTYSTYSPRAFGASVDIGVHQDGLVHVSQLSDRFVKDPSTVVRVGDALKVRVLAVDLARKRISLSAKGG